MHRHTVLMLFVLSMLVHHATLQCPAYKVSEQGRLELLQSQLKFSADLLRIAGSLQPSENLFLSPSSVFNSLILAYFISGNQTEAALRKALRIPKNKDKLDTLGAYKLEKYYYELRAINSSLSYRLSNANRMYVSNELEIEPCAKERFQEEIQPMNFKDDATNTIKRINGWVASQTRNNIIDLLGPSSLNANTNLVLVNAAYFRGVWKNMFSTRDTMEAEFTLANGERVPVKMMSVENTFNRRIDEKLGTDILELPYQGDDISMFILLPLKPSATAIADLLGKIDETVIQDLVNKSSASKGQLSVMIPKFTADHSLELTSILKSLGVGDLFDSTADLRSLTKTTGLRLDTAVHKAVIAVDEVGTEAAAATAIFANRFGVDMFVANHPFVYFLFEKKCNILLFAGVFNSPKT